MENLKFENYIKEKGVPFPKIESLDLVEQKDILHSLSDLIKFSFNYDKLFDEISNKLFNMDFDEEFTYDIHSIFKQFNLSYEENTFVIWSKNEIDKFKTNILLDNWEYIWYGVGDEAIILYQKANKKILLITHYGRIFYL